MSFSLFFLYVVVQGEAFLQYKDSNKQYTQVMDVFHLVFFVVLGKTFLLPNTPVNTHAGY